MIRRDKSCWITLALLTVWSGSLFVVTAQETVPVEQKQESIIQWKDESMEDVIHIEDIKVEAVTIPQTTKYYNVPLSKELQEHIFAECEKHNIAPAIIIAMIERESNFNVDAVGDKGGSLGLMQVQPKWHKERMERLGCTDLIDPYQNTTVGIDIVAELKDKNPELYWVLMAYNGGDAYATRCLEADNISSYALEVVERASELQSENENSTPYRPK